MSAIVGKRILLYKHKPFYFRVVKPSLYFQPQISVMLDNDISKRLSKVIIISVIFDYTGRVIS